MNPKPIVIAVQKALTEIAVLWKMEQYLKRLEEVK